MKGIKGYKVPVYKISNSWGCKYSTGKIINQIVITEYDA